MTVETSAQRTSGYAIASLVLGIAGLAVFPLIPSILAIVFASSAKQEIRQNAQVGGEGLATAGAILGWVGVALSVVGILVVVLVFASFTA